MAQELPLQVVAVEFHVTGSLNGSKRPGAFPIPPARVGVGNPCQPALVEIDDLGLVDLTAVGLGGALADRIVTNLLILGPTPPTADNNIQIALDGVAVSNQLTIPAAANGIYSRACIFVPQGHELRLSGMASIPGNVILVQIGFQLADTLQALAEMKKACCCLGTQLNMFGEPAFIRALYTEAACSRTITNVAPTPVSRAVGTQGFVILGTGFTNSDVAAFVNQDTGQLLPILSVSSPGPNVLNVTVDVSVAVPGTYNVIVAAALSGGLCSATAVGAVVITP